MNNWINRITYLLLVFVLTANVATAGRPLVVDDIEPTSEERIALELGTTAEVGSGVNRFTLPACVAWGAATDLELSGFVAAHVSTSAPAGSSESGLGDLGFGVKWKLLSSDKSSLGLALTAALTIPTAHEGFGAGAATGDLTAVATWTRGPTHVDLNAGYSHSAASGHVPSSGYVHGGVALRHRATDDIAGVAEVHGDDADGTLGVSGVGAGLQYTLNDSTWLDGAIGASTAGGDVRLLLTVGVTAEF